MESSQKRAEARLAAVATNKLALRVQLAALGAVEFGASKESGGEG